MKKNIIKRLICYFLGLFIMTAGIALSVKSNLGVSPVSSIPYTITCVFGLEMGKATILFHCFLVLLQIIILRKKFQWINLLQIPVGIVFGYFTTFCNSLINLLPTLDNIFLRGLFLLLSVALIGFGIFLYLPANIMPLAGEGIIKAVSDITHLDFSKTKIFFDATLVLISAITCLCVLHRLGSVGFGTVFAALTVGLFHKLFTKLLATTRDRILNS